MPGRLVPVARGQRGMLRWHLEVPKNAAEPSLLIGSYIKSNATKSAENLVGSLEVRLGF
jgi:hypothetical protein